MINTVVEGESDRGVAKAVIRAASRQTARIIVKGGKSRLDPLISKYNMAAAQGPWIVFRDSDTECPVELYARLTSGIATRPQFLLRIAHPMSEGWLLADTRGFASYFQVNSSQIPREPEGLQNAKASVLQLCSASRSRRIRQDMVAKSGKTGPLYVNRINEFATTRWDVEAAAQNSPSLRRALERIRQLPN